MQTELLSLFERATIERYLDYWRRLLEAMVADDAQAVDQLPMLGAEERQREGDLGEHRA